MKKQKGYVGITIIFWLLWIALAGAAIWAYIANAIKLSDCDFVAPYKCEVIHAVGLIPPAQVATVWFDSDKIETTVNVK